MKVSHVSGTPRCVVILANNRGFTNMMHHSTGVLGLGHGRKGFIPESPVLFLFHLFLFDYSDHSAASGFPHHYDTTVLHFLIITFGATYTQHTCTKEKTVWCALQHSWGLGESGRATAERASGYVFLGLARGVWYHGWGLGWGHPRCIASGGENGIGSGGRRLKSVDIVGRRVGGRVDFFEGDATYVSHPPT